MGCNSVDAPERQVDAWKGSPTAGQQAAWESLREQVRITVRPIASPSTVGLFGLAAATFTVSGLQLDWVPKTEGKNVALVLIAFAFISQLLASVLATFARDVVVSSAMCVLALTWLVTGLVMYTSPPGSTSDALALFLVFSAIAMFLIGVAAGLSKVVPAAVFITASLRFAVTAGYQFSGSTAWKTISGVVGLVLFALAIYAGFALLIEGATKKTVLPIGRRGPGALAVHGSLLEQVKDAANEPGVRTQL